MTNRPLHETIQSLRLTLEKLGEFPEADPVSMAELKRIVLKRIAELEVAGASATLNAAPPSEVSE